MAFLRIGLVAEQRDAHALRRFDDLLQHARVPREVRAIACQALRRRPRRPPVLARIPGRGEVDVADACLRAP